MLGERGWGPGGGEGMPSNSDHETKISLGYAQGNDIRLKVYKVSWHRS